MYETKTNKKKTFLFFSSLEPDIRLASISFNNSSILFKNPNVFLFDINSQRRILCWIFNRFSSNFSWKFSLFELSSPDFCSGWVFRFFSLFKHLIKFSILEQIFQEGKIRKRAFKILAWIELKCLLCSCECLNSFHSINDFIF